MIDAGRFGEVVDLVMSADGRGDRAAAVVLAAEVAGLEFAGWLQRRRHLLVRGGASALLREALAVPALRVHAQARLAVPGAPRLRARLVATTRPGFDGRLWCYESGLGVVHAAFTPAAGAAGSPVHVFGHGDYSDAGPDSGRSDWFVGLSGDGVPGPARPAGQTREGDGTFAVSPDGTLLAIRSHRDIALHALPSLAPLGVLDGCDGPGALWFLDERRLLSLDGCTLDLWDARSGSRLATSDSVGSQAMAVRPDGRHVVVGGGAATPHAVHALPSLRLVGLFSEAPNFPHGRRSTGAVAFAPSGHHVLTGDRHNDVRLWDVSSLLDGLDDSACAIDPATGRHVVTAAPVTLLGRHTGWVEAARFVDEHTVVTGGWDGAVLAWDTTRPGIARGLGGHAGYVTAVDVSPDRRSVLSAASDGTVNLWDPIAAGVDPPPYAFAYGGSGSATAMHSPQPGQIVVTVGARSILWAGDGTRLDEHAAAAPDTARSAFPDRGLYAEWAWEPYDPAHRCFRLRDDTGTVVDEIQLDAAPIHMAAVDASTLAVLDHAGQLSFWHIS